MDREELDKKLKQYLKKCYLMYSKFPTNGDTDAFIKEYDELSRSYDRIGIGMWDFLEKDLKYIRGNGSDGFTDFTHKFMREVMDD